MRISRLTTEGDWTFGRGLANYATDREALFENLITRLKSFANDWFLDTDANIDWLSILALKSNETLIFNEVSRVITETQGIVKLNSLTVDNEDQRKATLNVNVTTIFDNDLFLTVDI